jgi:hypothetical protein
MMIQKKYEKQESWNISRFWRGREKSQNIISAGSSAEIQSGIF